MRKLVISIGGAAAAVVLYSAAQLTAIAQTPPSYLFVQSAKKVDCKDGILTLYDVPRQTIFFSDRPNRVVGNLPTEKFVAKWTDDKRPNGFATVPPNAALTVFQPDGVKTAIVELSNPRMQGNNLSYNIKVLQGVAGAQSAEGVLFIDDYTGWAKQAFDSTVN